MIRSRLNWAAIALILAAAVPPAPSTAQTTRPRGRNNAPTIPDVPRDQLIGFCLYTVHNGVLKLTAQLYPLHDGDSRDVQLEIERDGTWRKVADARVHDIGWMATFRVEDWDSSVGRRYRVRHGGGASYEGFIRSDPKDKDEIVVAALSCNSNSDRGPRQDIVDNLKAQDPDLLFFAGDQSYDHHAHTAAWLLFGRQFHEIMRDRPTITIPDDHDVGHPNLWGAGGKISNRPGGVDGGFMKPVEYVNMVQRAQTSHLPDPFDPTPIDRGITVYYTSMNVGGIDFAIIEDRKWKSGPLGIVPPHNGPRPDHIVDPEYDRASVDVPGAELLGQRQLKFLRQWGTRWDDAQMKVVLSQTIFAGATDLSGAKKERIIADLDTNGWPQSGRNAALAEIRRCFGFMIGGDQHLATVIHHGIDEWEDAGISFCSPSIWNFYGRWWHPLQPPIDHDPENPLPWTGRYLDGFGNKITMHAYANPAEGNHMGAGYGLVRFKKSSRQITMECWPRFVDVTKPDAKQFTGWPMTVTQQANYGRKPQAWLPTLRVKGPEDPLVQVVDESSGEIVYTLRANGREFRPWVFKPGRYTISVGEGENLKTFNNIEAADEKSDASIDVEL